jgi:ribosome-binding protein aMBF1 (putative translation factor)
MIKNERQLKITKERLKELKASLIRLKRKYKGAEFELYSTGVREHIEQLERELKEYEYFKHQPRVIRAYTPETDRLDIARAIAGVRISQGMTQAELAEKIQCQQENITRLESEDYQGYTVKQLQKIAEAVGARLEINFVRVDNGKKRTSRASSE